MKPVCLIPARGGSKGLHRKNIKTLAGKPLITHAIKSSLNSKIFSTVVVSTEDKKIASIAKKYGAEVPFLRPKKLASDSASMDDVVMHSIRKLRSLGYNFDILVNRDCTAPFIKNSDIEGMIRLLRKKRCNLVVAAYKTHLNPYFNMMETDSNGYLKFSKRTTKKIENRQNAPIVYQLNGVFAMNVHQFMKYGRTYMPKILPYEISPARGLMIDTEFEFQIANSMAKKKITF